MKFEFYSLEEALEIWCDSESLLNVCGYGNKHVFGIHRKRYKDILNGNYLSVEFRLYNNVPCAWFRYNEHKKYLVPMAFIKNIILEDSDSEGMILEAINYI